MRPLQAHLFQERPKKKLSKEADKAARMAIGSGDLAKVLKLQAVSQVPEGEIRLYYGNMG